MKPHYSTLAASILCAAASLASADTIIGTDLHSINTAIPEINALLSANRGTNGGGDQSLQFGDQLQGTEQDDIIIGGLGIDILFGGKGNDVLVGGTEDFNPFNRDRAFGQEGDDVFLWAPGDGNDFFDGGEGADTLIITLIGEQQDFDGIFLDANNQPIINVSGSPGFCTVLAAAEDPELFAALDLDHLVRFSLRGVANAFDQGLRTDDDGLRVAISTRNVEYLVCTDRNTGISVLDLTTTPATAVELSQIPDFVATMIQ